MRLKKKNRVNFTKLIALILIAGLLNMILQPVISHAADGGTTYDAFISEEFNQDEELLMENYESLLQYEDAGVILNDDVIYKPGDVNMDGSIDLSDAIKVLRYIVGLVKLAPEQVLLANVSGSGFVNINDAILILRYIGGLIDSLPYTVILASLTLSGSPDLIYSGADFSFDLNDLALAGTDQFGDPYDISGEPVTWTLVSGPAAIDADGHNLTITNSGTVTVNAAAHGVTSNNLELTVEDSTPVPVSAIDATPEEMTMLAGGAPGTITATISPDNATNKNVNWTSDNETVATVADGVVTPIAAGNAVITATTEDGGFTGTTAVTVSDTATVSTEAELAAALNAGGVTTVTLESGTVTGNLNIIVPGQTITGTGAGSAVIDGNVTVEADNITIKDLTVNDTVTVADGVDTFAAERTDFYELIINGGGAESIHLDSVDAQTVTINKDGVRVELRGSSTVSTIIITELAQGTRLELKDYTAVGTATVNAADVILAIGTGATVSVIDGNETPDLIDLLRVTFGIKAGEGSIALMVGSNSVLSGEEKDRGKELIFTATPAEGYRIKHWIVDGSPVGLTDATYTVTDLQESLDVKIEFEVISDEPVQEYTVTFKDHDGTILNTETVAHGASATAPDDPDREGYTFTGWDVDFSDITSNLEVTAVYEEIIGQYQLTFSSTAGGTTHPEGSLTLSEGETIAIEALADIGYTFTGWSTSNGEFGNFEESSTFFTMPETNVTVTANFIINEYTVTFEDWDGTELKVETVEHGSSATAPPDQIREGYTFTGWDTDFTNVTENLKVSALYEINNYTVAFRDWDETELKTETVAHGSGATAPDDPEREGHTFTDWDTVFTDVTADLTVTARYSLNQYTVTFDSAGGSIVDAITQDYGTLITPPADPTKEGHTFGCWYEDVEEITTAWDFEIDTVPAADITLYAKWIINYTLTYKAGSNGSISGDTVQVIAHGSDGVEVIAIPDEGYHFVRWSDGLTTASRTETNVTGDINVEAEFAINTYTVEFNVVGSTRLLQDADVTINGLTKSTDEQGTAFFDLAKGTYSYSVNHFDYQEETGSINVSNEAVTEILFLTKPTYRLTMHVDVDDIPIEDAKITLENETKWTDEDGTAAFYLFDGTYSYNISRQGYFDYNGSVTISGTSQQMSVSLEPRLPKANFHVTDGQNPVEYADIRILVDNQYVWLDLLTDKAGNAVLELKPGTYDYRVGHAAFENYYGTMVLSEADIFQDVTLTWWTDTITFHVVDHNNNIVEGARIVSGTGEAVTDEQGEATIESNSPTWRVEKGGHKTVSGYRYGREHIEVTLPGVEHTVVLTVTENDIPLAGVKISGHGKQYVTDAEGKVTMKLKDGVYSFHSSKNGYEPGDISITVSMGPVFLNVPISQVLFELEFNITDEDDPVVGAEVIVGDNRVLTNGQGQAVFNIPYWELYGQYHWEVKADGYHTSEGFDLSLEDRVFNLNLNKLPVVQNTFIVEDSHGGGSFLSDVAVTVGAVTVYTDENGTAVHELSVCPTFGSTYKYEISKPGYFTRQGTLIAYPNDTHYMYLTRDYDSPFGRQDFWVIDGETQMPMEGVLIGFGRYGAFDDFMRWTDSRGYASFNLPPGVYNYKIGYDWDEPEGWGHCEYGVLTGSVEVPWSLLELTFSMFEQHEVEISVTDGTHGLSYAYVEIGDTSGNAGSDGHFFTQLKDGTYDLTVTREGYLTYSGSLTVDGTDVSREVILTDAPHEITLIVADGSENPVTGAEITIDNKLLLTDENGIAVTYLPRGDYSYSVSAADYTTSSGTLMLGPNDSSHNITLSPKTKTINVRVAAGGKAAEGAVVNIDGFDSITTDVMGRARFWNLPYGEYNYTVTKDGYVEQSGSIIVNDLAHSEYVTLQPKKYKVTFNITGETEPLEGATVSVAGGDFYTDSGGNVEVELANGTYWYRINAPDFEAEEGEFTLSGEDKILPAIDLSPELHRVHIIAMAGSEPLVGATVTVGEAEKTTDENGRAVFQLASADYAFSINAEDYIEYEGTVTVAGVGTTRRIQMQPIKYPVTFTVNSTVDGDLIPLEGASLIFDGIQADTDNEGKAVFHVANGTYAFTAEMFAYYSETGDIAVDREAVEVTLNLERVMCQVTINVKEGDTVISEAQVTLGSETVSTDENGNAVFNIPMGSYVYSISAGSYVTETGNLEVIEDNITYDVTLKPVQYEVNLTVLHGENPVAGASVNVGNTTLTADESGMVSLNLVNGVYTYSITAQGYRLKEGDLTVDDDPLDVSVSVVPKTYTVTFEVNKGTGLISHVSINGQNITTDAQGIAEIELVKGVYDYTVTAEEYIPASGHIAVSGADISKNVTLLPQTYAVTFSVVDTADSPISGAVVAIGDDTMITAGEGTAVFNLSKGTYSYSITAPGYQTTASSIEVDGTLQAEVTMQKYHDVVITVTDGTDVIAGAQVTVENDSKTTDEDGRVFFSLLDSIYTYTVSKSDYENQEDLSLTVSGSNLNLAVELERNKYPLVFEIIDDESNPVVDAWVRVGTERLSTDSQGKVSFQVFSGDISYLVEKEGFKATGGSAHIPAGQTEETTVTLSLVPEVVQALVEITANEGANPVAGVSITVDGKTWTTDQDGRAELIVTTGEYEYLAAKDGYDEMSDSFNVGEEGLSIVLEMVKTLYTVDYRVLTDEQPLEGAAVKINGTEKTTDTEGEVRFLLTGGTYDYIIEKSGHETRQGTITVTANRTITVPMTIIPYIVDFQLRDDNDNPLQGVSVTIGNKSSITDEQGKALFSLVSGSYTYVTGKQGYTETTGIITVDSAPLSYTATMSLQLFPVTFLVKKGQDPIKDAVVTVGNISRQTDAHGEVILDLVNGVYDYTVNSTGYHEQGGSIIVDNGPSHQNVAMVPRPYPVTFTLTTGNEPAERVTISIYKDGVIHSSRETNAEGKAVFNLVNGDYSYKCHDNGFMYETVNESFTVSSDAASIPVLINLRHAFYVFDYSALPRPQNLSGATVTINGQSKETDDRGFVTFFLADGQYDFSATHADFFDISGQATVSYDSRHTSVEMWRDSFDYTFQVYRDHYSQPFEGATISIGDESVVTDAAGRATMNLKVDCHDYKVSFDDYMDIEGSLTVHRRGLFNALTVTMEQKQHPVKLIFTDGSQRLARVDVLVGESEYRSDENGEVTFTKTSGTYNISYTAEGYNPQTGTVTVAGGPVTENLLLAAKPVETVFTVKDEFIIIEDATITIGDESLSTDVNGRAAFQLMPGTYEYQIEHEDYLTKTGSFTVQPVSTPGISFVLIEKTYPVEFTVSFDGTPIQGADITAGNQTATTDEDGKATLYLKKGETSYTVDAHGYKRAEETIEITPKPDPVSIPVELLLQDYRVTFTVTDETEAIRGANITIDGKTITTDGSGNAYIRLFNGQYNYEVSAFGYYTKSGSVTVSSDAVYQTVTLSASLYPVTLTITDAVGAPLDGVSVRVAEDLEATTDSDGSVVFQLEGGEYEWTAELFTYHQETGSMIIAGEHLAKTITLTAMSIDEFAIFLLDNEEDASEMALLLREHFNPSAAEMARLLLQNATDPDEAEAVEVAILVVEVLRDIYEMETAEIVVVLKEIDISAADIYEVLDKAGGISDNTIMISLKAEFDIIELMNMLFWKHEGAYNIVVSVLKDTGYNAIEIAQGLISSGIADVNAAKLLKDAGYTESEITDVLAEVYSKTVVETAEIFTLLGYSAMETGTILNDFGVEVSRAVRMMKNGGFGAQGIFEAVKSLWGLEDGEIASMLKQAGFKVEKIGAALIENSNYSGRKLGFLDYYSDDIAEVTGILTTMYYVGFGATETVKALDFLDYSIIFDFNRDPYYVYLYAQMLADAGYDVYEVAAVTKDLLEQNDYFAVQVLSLSGFSLDEICGALRQVYETSGEKIVYALKNYKGHYQDILFTIGEQSFDYAQEVAPGSPNITASLLKAGYSASDIVKGMYYQGFGAMKVPANDRIYNEAFILKEFKAADYPLERMNDVLQAVFDGIPGEEAMTRFARAAKDAGYTIGEAVQVMSSLFDLTPDEADIIDFCLSGQYGIYNLMAYYLSERGENAAFLLARWSALLAEKPNFSFDVALLVSYLRQEQGQNSLEISTLLASAEYNHMHIVRSVVAEFNYTDMEEYIDDFIAAGIDGVVMLNYLYLVGTSIDPVENMDYLKQAGITALDFGQHFANRRALSSRRAVQHLFQAQFSLDEILYVMKYIFAIDAGSAYLFLRYNGVSDILAALERFYGHETLVAIVNDLKNEGYPADLVALHLREMEIEAAPAAVAMEKVGYSVSDILSVMATIYDLYGVSWEELEGVFEAGLEATLLEYYKSLNWRIDRVVSEFLLNTGISCADELYPLLKNVGYDDDSILFGIRRGSNFINDPASLKNFIENNLGQTGMTAVETVLNLIYEYEGLLELPLQYFWQMPMSMYDYLGVFGFTLKLRALKEYIFPDDVWHVYYAVLYYSKQAVVPSWEAVYGEHPILSVLKRSLQGDFNFPQVGRRDSRSSLIMPPFDLPATLEFNAVCFVVAEFGIKDPVQIAGFLKEAGYTQQQVFEGLLSVQQYGVNSPYHPQLDLPQTDQGLSFMLMEVLKEVYGMTSNDINDIIAIVKATDFKQEYTWWKEIVYNRPRLNADAARDVFPEFSRGDMLLILKDVGYTLDEIYEDILKEPGHAVDTSIVDVFRDLDLSALQAVTHLVNCNYPKFGVDEMSQVISLMDEQGYLVHDYVPYLAGRFSMPKIVRALIDNEYNLAAIVKIIYPLYLEKGEKRYYYLAADLIRGDIGLEDALLALLDIEMPKNKVIDMLYRLRYEYSVIQNDPKSFGAIAYNVGLTIEEIARGLIPLSINAHDKFMSVFNATGAYINDKGSTNSDLITLIRGLGHHRVRLFMTAGAMKSAGYSSSFMMSRMRNCARVGWREATLIMLVAGYRTDRVIREVWRQYRSRLIRDAIFFAGLKVAVARFFVQYSPYFPYIKRAIRVAKYAL